MKRKRGESNQDEKFHQEDANDYHQQLSSSNIPGNSYFRLVVDRSKGGGGAKNRDSTKRGHLVFAVTQDDQVKQWELLDPQASRESIRRGGQAVGYGPGISEPLKMWNQEQRSHRKETGVTILTTDGATTTTTGVSRPLSAKESLPRRVVVQLEGCSYSQLARFVQRTSKELLVLKRSGEGLNGSATVGAGHADGAVDDEGDALRSVLERMVLGVRSVARSLKRREKRREEEI